MLVSDTVEIVPGMADDVAPVVCVEKPVELPAVSVVQLSDVKEDDVVILELSGFDAEASEPLLSIWVEYCVSVTSGVDEFG